MPDTQKVRDLNDQFRTTFNGGRVSVTRGIAARTDLGEIFNCIRTFEDFATDNNPFGENDFGAFEAGKDTIFWKIDYYTPDLSSGSEDPSNPDLTARVLTIMLAEEY